VKKKEKEKQKEKEKKKNMRRNCVRFKETVFAGQIKS